MENNLTYSSEVRKGLIGLLMFTLYSDEKTIYREYVQNALDSINKAVAEGILSQAKDGVVNITIDDKAKRILIRDNGTGIEAENAVRVLLDISASSKDGIHQAGQFGIGRLVGGGYCHELRFRTSAKGEDVGTEIVFDVDRIWQMVKEDEEDYLATQVIDTCTRRMNFEESRDEHYFEVVLNDVKDDAATELLNTDKVAAYLNAVAPVGYKPEFNNALVYKSGKMYPEFEPLHRNLEKVQLFVGQTRIQKQYGLTVKGTKDKIDHLEYFKLEDEQFGMLGWGWFAMTMFTIQIPQSDELVGIRLRKHNIQIGDATQLSNTNYWKESRGNSYFYGEVFVTHPDIHPNGARDGLAPGPATTAFQNRLKEQFERLRELYTKANVAKKCIDKIKEGIKRIETTGKEDYKSRDLIDNNGTDKFKSLVAKASSPFMSKMLELYQPGFDEAAKKAKEVKKSVSAIKPSVEPVSAVTPTVVSEDPVETKPQPSPTPDTPPYTIETTEPSDPTPAPNIPETVPPLVEQPVTPADLFGRKDKLAALEHRVDKSEIWVLRRVFKVMNKFCPPNEHDKQLIEEMQKMIVKEFEDGK